GCGLHSCGPSELLSRLVAACALWFRRLRLGQALVARRCGPVLLGRLDGSKTRPHTTRLLRSRLLRLLELRRVSLALLGQALVARRCGPVLLGRLDGSKTRPHTTRLLRSRLLRLLELRWVSLALL